MLAKKQIELVCYDCGMRYGNREYGDGQISTWHMGGCDLCGKYAPLTKPRDYGHLTLPRKD